MSRPPPQCQVCARLRVFFQVSLGAFYVKGNGTILAMCDFPRSAGCLFEVNLRLSAAVAPATCCKSHQLRVLRAVCEKQEKKGPMLGWKSPLFHLPSLYICVSFSLGSDGDHRIPTSTHIDLASVLTRNFLFPTQGSTVESSRLYTRRAQARRSENAKLPKAQAMDDFWWFYKCQTSTFVFVKCFILFNDC